MAEFRHRPAHARIKAQGLTCKGRWHLKPFRPNEPCVINSSFSRRGRWFAAPSTWSITLPFSESGNRALRYKTPDPRNVARPSIIRQRRSDMTCGRCDRSTPARLSLGQCATDRFSPTATKYESWTGDCTAITRQFAQSFASIEASIWSRRGNSPPCAISVQSRSTRSTSRRLNTIFIVSETMFDIASSLGYNYSVGEKGFGCLSLSITYCLSLYRRPSPVARGRTHMPFRGPWDTSRNFVIETPYLPLTLI